MNLNGRASSVSSEDDVPLKSYSSHPFEPKNSYKSLCRRVRADCEFCEQSFINRYQVVIHNTSHIIIPLLNLNVLECEHCRFCYTSASDLQMHMSKAHSVPVLNLKESRKKRVKMRNRIEYEDDFILTIPDLLTDLTNSCSVTLNRTVGEEIKDKIETTFKEEYNLSLGDRIKDEFDMIERDSVSVDPIVSYNGFVNGFSDTILNNGCVHYEELTRPAPTRCKYCKKMFKDRYDLAVHQMCHMRLNYRRVYTGSTPERKIPKTCVDTHSPSPLPRSNKSLIQICDLCYRFLKPNARLQYIKKGVLSLPGIRSPCNMCSKKFFELNMVARTRSFIYKRREKGCRKRLTNDQRLKNIWHRLKAANKALKTCFSFYLTCF